MNNLKSMIIKYDLISESLRNFWISFEDYRIEEPLEFDNIFGIYDKEWLELFVDAVSYKVFNWPKCDFTYIVVSIKLYYQKKYIGYYDACYNLKGKIEDDFLVTQLDYDKSGMPMI